MWNWDKRKKKTICSEKVSKSNVLIKPAEFIRRKICCEKSKNLKKNIAYLIGHLIVREAGKIENSTSLVQFYGFLLD